MKISESRVWGKFETYYESKESKVKRLIIEPSKSISMQYHSRRAEFWFVESGVGKIYTLVNDQEVFQRLLNKHEYYRVDVGKWHRLENIGNSDLEIIEIQYGEECTEEDIVRR
jgi:mannose-6-phosphate isomerase-like protein (cupin superfamily)